MMVVLWILLIICVLWLALTEVPAGWDGHWQLPYVIALSQFLWIPALVLVVLGVVTHEWGYALCALGLFVGTMARKSEYVLNDLKSPNTAQAVADHLARNKAKQQRKQQAAAVKTDAGVRAAETDQTAGEPDAKGESRKSTSSQVQGRVHGQFNVMTLNCRYGRADAAQIVREVRERDIAVLALQEVSTDLVTRLRAQGLDELLPFHELGVKHPEDNGGFNGVWIRVEPSCSEPEACDIPAADVPAVTMPVSSQQSITFASAHTKSPMRGCKQWSQGCIGLGALVNGVQERGVQGELAAPREMVAQETVAQSEMMQSEMVQSRETVQETVRSGDSVRGQTTEQTTEQATEQTTETVRTQASMAASPHDIVVLMGDLNSSIVHPSFRKLLASGFRDAALSEAKGMHATYPSWLPWPRMVLDHILFTGHVQASGVESFVVTGTDHLALTATLTLPAPHSINPTLLEEEVNAHRAASETLR
ncbi:endonuclease/exonuclease/phosphatase family protein [Bifidobacterium gallicum]|uniref:Endonuclease/exonuclease/phosphatase family protein n=1 Tax=Bifidobacterium gallicum DSM 20093 = LMG 11596 TaxID=561180 RepID=D1NUE5_9BIFI|nr:endonuclease/exonuclease/phosphatase family protein [Bifidobacterium gallicum]EFA23349.1 endonuclease/exonuclease/phosphatase family protein [Bifidobacterium gallicum DSM 20093 = LMG 11596]KFI57890.1 endonuclease/exonuclease/phosphatase family protein [Bifidobacterium gallicum DSM 20093 = LMG 11596]